MAVSQGLGTTEFANLIGRDPPAVLTAVKIFPSRHFAGKRLQIVMEKKYLFIYGSTKKSDKEKSKEDEQTSVVKFSSSPFASKMSASTNRLHQ